MNKTLTKFASVALGAALLAVPLAVTRAAAAEWNTTGDYDLAFNYLGSDYAHDLTLAQDGSGNLTGNGGNPANGAHVYSWVIDSGSVDGDTISFTAHYTASADAVTPLTVMHVTGTIAADGTMSGTWDDNYQNGARAGTWKTTSGAALESDVSTSNTVVVTGNTSAGENLPGWYFNRDSTAPYEFNTDAHSIGTGSLYVKPIGATPAEKFIGENFLNVAVEDVDSISFDFKIAGDANADADDSEQFYLNVYTNFGSSPDLKFYDCRYDVVAAVGSTAGFTTVTFDPTQAYPVTQSGSSPQVCPATPAGMDALSVGSNIRAIAVTVGDSSASDIGVGGYLDNVVVNLDSGTTIYDFEPVVVAPVDVCANIPGNQATVPPGKVQDGPNCVDPTPVPTTPTDKNQCKNGGWMSFTNPSFKNQGQCVSYTNHN